MKYCKLSPLLYTEVIVGESRDNVSADCMLKRGFSSSLLFLGLDLDTCQYGDAGARYTWLLGEQQETREACGCFFFFYFFF